jgi:hypothetical protein
VNTWDDFKPDFGEGLSNKHELYAPQIDLFAIATTNFDGHLKIVVFLTNA